MHDLRWNSPSEYLADCGVSTSSEILKNIREGKEYEALQAAGAAICESEDEAEHCEESEIGTQGHVCPEGTWWTQFTDQVSRSWEYIQGRREARLCEETLADWHGRPAELGTLWADRVIDKVASGPKLRGEVMLVFFFSLFWSLIIKF